MKRIIFILMGLFISILPTSVFAFPPEPGNDPDVLPVPINDYLWMLIPIGLVYVFFKFKTFII